MLGEVAAGVPDATQRPVAPPQVPGIEERPPRRPVGSASASTSRSQASSTSSRQRRYCGRPSRTGVRAPFGACSHGAPSSSAQRCHPAVRGRMRVGGTWEGRYTSEVLMNRGGRYGKYAPSGQGDNHGAAHITRGGRLRFAAASASSVGARSGGGEGGGSPGQSNATGSHPAPCLSAPGTGDTVDEEDD